MKEEWKVLGEDDDITTSGGFIGYVDKTYDGMIDLFGHPIRYHDPGKVKAEWVIRSKAGKEFWIYDYKSRQRPEDRTYWHVGGSRIAATAVFKELKFKMYDERKF